jgi:hypothetical protein
MKKLIILIVLLTAIIVINGCGKKDAKSEDTAGDQGVEFSPQKDMDIQRYNLEKMKKEAKSRFPGDTISLMEYVLDSYPSGTYLVNYDLPNTYSVNRPAVIYLNNNGLYVVGVVAKSKPDERLIETKNIVGYDQSYIDLDSTKLGTAFFYLTLFHFSDGQFSVVWESPIPSHGGFNNISINKWEYLGTPYVKVNFYFAQGVGHIDYNYFMVDGLTQKPHLLMTYQGINFERTMANINNDKYADYYEHIFFDYGDRVVKKDSIGFVWSPKDSMYVSIKGRRMTRPY